MNKSLWLGMFIVVFVGSVTIATIMTVNAQDDATVTMQINPGWNLIGTGTDRDQSLFSEAKYIFVYIPVLNKYFPLKPESESEKIKAQNELSAKGLNIESIDQRIRGSYWYYFPTKKTLTVNVYSKKDIRLFSGWNFRYIEPWMAGNKISDISGTCSVKKMYGFDSERQTWKNISLQSNDTLKASEIGAGFLLSVDNECSLGLKTPEMPALPALPN